MFLIINLTVFSVLGLFTIIYLEAIQPTLVKERSDNHKVVINNTKDNLERLNIEYTKEGIRDFLLSTRFLFQSLDRVQFYDLSGNLIGDTNILDLDQSVFTGSDIIFEEALGGETITPEIYHDLISLLDQGFIIREYTQVYEEITYRVPVQFVGKDFYKYFPFSRSNQNTLYLFFHRTFDILFSILGLLFGLLISPIIFFGNLIANKGPLLYTQERVGKNGKPFQIVKLRSMIVNAENGRAEWAQKDRISYENRVIATSLD